MTDINWNNLEMSIKNIKNPLSIFYLIISNKKIMTDYELSLVIRYYLKFHSDNLFKYDFTYFYNYLKDFPLSKSIINDFYFIINKQNKLIKKLKNIKKNFIKKSFWLKDVSTQVNQLNKDYDIFRSIFDSTKGNFNFINNLISVKKLQNKEIHEMEIIKRLELLLKLFGKDFFEKNNILLITYQDFYELNFTNKIKYLNYIYLKIDEILLNYINIFEFYYSLYLQLDNLLNPTYINIIIKD